MRGWGYLHFRHLPLVRWKGYRAEGCGCCLRAVFWVNVVGEVIGIRWMDGRQALGWGACLELQEKVRAFGSCCDCGGRGNPAGRR
jgi:hypothetical protein